MKKTVIILLIMVLTPRLQGQALKLNEFKNFAVTNIGALSNQFSPFGNYFVFTSNPNHIELWDARLWKKL